MSDPGAIALLIRSVRLMREHMEACPMCEGVADMADRCDTCREMDSFLSGTVVPIPEEGYVVLASLPGKEKKLESLFGPLFTSQRDAEVYHRDEVPKDVQPLTKVFRAEVYIKEEVTGDRSVLGVRGQLSDTELRELFRHLHEDLSRVLADEVDDWIVTQGVLHDAEKAIQRHIKDFVEKRSLPPEFLALFEQIQVEGDVGRVRDGDIEGALWLVYPEEMRRYLPKL